jgi:hypothetical protein
MTTREQIERAKCEIMIAARVSELRRLAEETTEEFERRLAASGLPREHFRLRAMLLGRLPMLPPQRKD